MIEILTSFTSKINIIEILFKLFKVIEFWEEKLIYTKSFIEKLKLVITTRCEEIDSSYKEQFFITKLVIEDKVIQNLKNHDLYCENFLIEYEDYNIK